MPEERGPSWWDVSQYVEDLHVRYGTRARFVFIPPHKVGPDHKWVSWGISCEVYRGVDVQSAVGARVEYFGKGGAWATAPAACHAALRALEARLAAREELARSAAPF